MPDQRKSHDRTAASVAAELLARPPEDPVAGKIRRRPRSPGHPAARWPVIAAVIAAGALYLSLPAQFTQGPGRFIGQLRWVVTGAEIALLAAVEAALLRRGRFTRSARRGVIACTAVISVANAVSLGWLVHAIYTGGHLRGRDLIVSATAIWWTNVMVFALWYWVVDGGGVERRLERHREDLPDLLFPLQQLDHPRAKEWIPAFADYLFVSFTNASAFSPTDTMPLTVRVKMLMLAQGAGSVLTLVMVASRAVNVI